jgi:hypothetical protein
MLYATPALEGPLVQGDILDACPIFGLEVPTTGVNLDAAPARWQVQQVAGTIQDLRLTRLVPPIVERVELSLNRRTALQSCFFEVSDGAHDVRVAHVPRRVIVLVNGKDAGVPLVQLVKSLEVCGVLRDDGKAMCGGEAKVDLVILPVQPHALIGRANHAMPRLSKEIRQEIGIRAIVKIQVEGHGRPLLA